jgi:anti-sigma factor RsiW
MPNPIASEIAPHHEAEELLPWYATGQLEADDLALVEDHLSSCAHCRRQLAFERKMVDQFAGLTPEVDTGWERLKQRLQPPSESWSGRARRELASVWQGFNRPAVAAFAFAQLAFVAIAGALLLSLSRPDYSTLSSAPPPQSANVVAMFSPDTTQAQLTGLLRSNGASLVDGPTPADAFLLHVPPQSRAAVLSRLRADRHVVMAEPIDKAGP